MKTIQVLVDVELKAVESSNMAFVGFLNNELYVEFKTGALYQYHNVPYNVYSELMEAESQGKYLNSAVKGSYEYTKIA